jgi:microcompartment protein CcmL/EutN
VKQSLGLIEVSGLALAITVSDVMAKVASIQLLDIEKTNGSGWMVVKIAGDVASVEAAVATGAEFARQRNGLIAYKVIARPINDLDLMLIQKKSAPKTKPNAPAAKATAKAVQSKPMAKPTLKPTAKPVAAKKAETVKKAATASANVAKATVKAKPAPVKPAAAKPQAKAASVKRASATKKPATVAKPPMTEKIALPMAPAVNVDKKLTSS